MAVKKTTQAMHWNASPDEERRFRIIVAVCLILALMFSLVTPMIEVPEVAREEAERLPPRLAKLILEKRKVEPPPPPKVEIPEPEPEPEPEKPKPEEKPEVEKPAKPDPKPEPEPTPKPRPKEPPKVDIEAARKKAASSGVLAMTDMLADLREAQPTVSLTSNKKLQSGGNEERKQSRSILVANAARGSGGINTAKLSRTTGGTALASRQTTEVVSRIESIEATAVGKGTGGRGGSGRSQEEITRVMNANYTPIFSIYQRALRKNPMLRGKVVFKITIAPSGKVTECKVISSELGDAKLERKLVLRIKRINFGAKEVKAVTVNFPIDFLPNL